MVPRIAALVLEEQRAYERPCPEGIRFSLLERRAKELRGGWLVFQLVLYNSYCIYLDNLRHLPINRSILHRYIVQQAVGGLTYIHIYIPAITDWHGPS